ncbi:MAG: hypothetical protein LBV73_24750 [Paraburkholderia sp.]|jgi:hypothetical protein|nr:hypothetical protein [Paraburkholderia sp.]
MVVAMLSARNKAGRFYFMASRCTPLIQRGYAVSIGDYRPGIWQTRLPEESEENVNLYTCYEPYEEWEPKNKFYFKDAKKLYSLRAADRKLTFCFATNSDSGMVHRWAFWVDGTNSFLLEIVVKEAARLFGTTPEKLAETVHMKNLNPPSDSPDLNAILYGKSFDALKIVRKRNPQLFKYADITNNPNNPKMRGELLQKVILSRSLKCEVLDGRTDVISVDNTGEKALRHWSKITRVYFDEKSIVPKKALKDKDDEKEKSSTE